jgi:hypothetical protein
MEKKEICRTCNKEKRPVKINNVYNQNLVNFFQDPNINKILGPDGMNSQSNFNVIDAYTKKEGSKNDNSHN